MDVSDLPDVGRQKAAEYRQINPSKPDSVELMLSGARRALAEKLQETQMQNEGQISRMTMPAGWSKSTVQHSLPVAANFVEYHADANKDAKLCTYYRGHRISQMAGKRFHEMLEAPPHDLSGADYASLKEVLRDKANPEDFVVSSKKTIKVNGKKVLLVEGKFKAIKQDTYSIYVDADDTGEVVQEIFFQAPQEVYKDYFEAALAAIRSIGWK